VLAAPIAEQAREHEQEPDTTETSPRRPVRRAAASIRADDQHDDRAQDDREHRDWERHPALNGDLGWRHGSGRRRRRRGLHGRHHRGPSGSALPQRRRHETINSGHRNPPSISRPERPGPFEDVIGNHNWIATFGHDFGDEPGGSRIAPGRRDHPLPRLEPARLLECGLARLKVARR
jgi:hypothetical protein